MRKLLTIFIIALSLSSFAQLPYNEGFESISSANTLPAGMSASNLGTNSFTYITSGTYNRTPHGGTDFASFRYISNDWFYTKGLALTAGTSYTFSVWYITDGATGFTFEAKYGTSQAAASMTGTITGASVTNPVNTSYAQMTGTFTPATSGTFYVGLHGTATSTPWYLSFDDIEVKATSANMSFVSCTTTQANVSSVSKSSSNNQIIGMEVVTTGTSNPLSISSFTFNTTGSTLAASDITNARIWTTGTSSTFATTTQLGSAVAAPNGAFTINSGTNLPYALSTGTNYFWLTYDIPAGAITNDVVDAECTQIIIGGTSRTPTATAPTGNRPIVTAASAANCDSYNGALSALAVGYVGTGTYTEAYALVNGSTNVIMAINTTGIFSGLAAGEYYIYAVNYEGVAPAALSVGNNWSVVLAYDAVTTNCIDLLSAYKGRKLVVCSTDSICEPNNIVVQAINYNAAAGYSLIYVLVSGNTILASNTTGIFTQAMYLNDGLFAIYAVNTSSAAVTTEIGNGGPWSDIPPLLLTTCTDILGPRPFFVRDISAGPCSALPIQLISFESSCIETAQVITWSTASETNNQYFTVEKSLDNLTFSPIATLAGSGNSTTVQQYSVTDYAAESIAYYRLKQTDFDGQSSFSNIITAVACTNNNQSADINIFRQSDNAIVVNFSRVLEENSRITIYSSLGQVVYSGVVLAGESSHQINGSLLEADAMYFFTILNSKQNITINRIL